MKKLVLISFLLVNSAFAASASWMSMLENVGGTYELINTVKITLRNRILLYISLQKAYTAPTRLMEQARRIKTGA